MKTTRDGALVVALRTGPMRSTLETLSGQPGGGLIGYNDHWRHIATARSTDQGKTWDWANRHFLFRWDMMAEMHSP